jgi:BirA family biotin operon repressor/biotin-[acetyl-CoA-carboxylase] ligase
MNAIEHEVENWTVWEYDSVTSTNLVAANLPAWNAVHAEIQTAGRGRFQRKWISDQGGLWLSAVVPTQAPASGVLPLLAGLAVCDVLRGLGVQDLRLRWPNDVLVRDRKLAGVLIDQFKPGLAVIGIGLNVNNQPAHHDPSLENHTQRLSDLVPTPAPIEKLIALMLARIRSIVEAANVGELPQLISRVNELWLKRRRVELDLDGDVRAGFFAGVDSAGRLLLQNGLGASTAYNPEQVRHLTEIPELHERNISPSDSIRNCRAN